MGIPGSKLVYFIGDGFAINSHHSYRVQNFNFFIEELFFRSLVSESINTYRNLVGESKNSPTLSGFR